MSYLPVLERLRLELDNTPEAIIAPRTKINSETPSSAVEKDPLSFSKPWVQTIRMKGEAFRKRGESDAIMAQRAKSNSGDELFDAVMGEDMEEKRKPPVVMKPNKQDNTRNSIFDADLFGPTEDSGPFYGGNLLDLMDATEGGGNYRTLFGHSQRDGGMFSGIDITKMTLGELKEFASPVGKYGQWVKGQVGRVATPMGRYQFVGSTLFPLAAEMGMSDNTVFDKQTQDRLFSYHLKKTLNAGSTMSEKVANLRGQWEGFKNVPTNKLVQIIRRMG